MFIEKGSGLIRMAFAAGFMLESSEPLTSGRLMGIVAGRAGQDSFLESVAFVELKFTEDILVAGHTVFHRACLEERGFGVFSMNGVA
jgi:hypothetical protein